MADTCHSKASVSSLASEVNVQGEFVTLATLREILQMQERMFKSFFDSIITNVNTRLNSLTHSVAELKARIASSEKDIDDLKPSLLKLQDLDSAIEESQEEQMEYLENQSRRNNVRVNGIPEENETWETTEASAVLLMLREHIAWVKVHIGQLRPRVLQIVLKLLFVAFVTGKRGKRS